ncbi:MAG TPA: glycosyltransferase family 39 protein [Terriglobia bacterium]|nr:glycosyltransferase family 39 protein [Terriglobia bacterium]
MEQPTGKSGGRYDEVFLRVIHSGNYRRIIFACALCGFALFGALLVLSVRQESLTYDEGCHVFAGYEYWTRSDFGINPEHPPLAKLLATTPLLHLELHAPPERRGTPEGKCWSDGRVFLNLNDASVLVFRARLAAGILAVMLGGLLFEAAWRMFGPGPALLAVVLFVFEPNILAHGALVTTDMAVACCLFAAVYAFYRYVARPTLLRLFECGFTAGLALAAKFSGILVFPILVVLALVELWVVRRFRLKQTTEKDPFARSCLRLGGALLAAAAISLVVLWASYGFRFSARPGGQETLHSLVEYGHVQSASGTEVQLGPRALLNLAHWRVLPHAYLHGLANVTRRVYSSSISYLFGEVYQGGHWFYFPAVFIIKSSLAFLLLLGLVLASKSLGLEERRREVLFMALPAVVYFLISLTSNLDIGVRHILPVYPFLIIVIAAGAWTMMGRRRSWRYAVVALLALHVVSSLRAFPDYLAYSNELWGGPAKTYQVLTDSNVDWGQGLIEAKEYLRTRHISDCWIAYYSVLDPASYGIPCRPLPGTFSARNFQAVPASLDGTILVGATPMVLSGPPGANPYLPSFSVHPADVIGGSILVFRGRFDFRLGSALSHVRVARELADAGNFAQALAEARKAALVAPDSVEAHQTLGDLLLQQHKPDEARREFASALSCAQSLPSNFQKPLVASIERKLAGL